MNWRIFVVCLSALATQDDLILDFATIYARFHSPIGEVNCGERCAPYNEYGVPFCCDTRHCVPTAYQAEWHYLQSHTDLWRLWQVDDLELMESLQTQTPEGQVLIVCQGHHNCQRHYRSITCRSFPFLPYITRQGEFIGLAYYWEYEDRCWVISNLQIVSLDYRREFIDTYDRLFAQMPDERQGFREFSTTMRRVFGRRRRAIPLLHRNGFAYKITPHNGRLRRVVVEKLPKFGDYRAAAEMPFPDELILE